MSERKKEPEEAQVQIIGKPFRRRVEPGREDSPLHRRVVRIIGGFRPSSGTVFHRPAESSPITPSDLPNTSLSGAEDLIDQAEVSRSLQTARKEGASQVGISVEQEYLLRGADGTKLSKDGGFDSSSERRRIRKIRQQTGKFAQNFLRSIGQ